MTKEERETREAIAADLRAVAALYSDKSNDYHCAVHASYMAAADRVLSPLPAPITTSADTSSGVLDDDDCCDDHD